MKTQIRSKLGIYSLENEGLELERRELKGECQWGTLSFRIVGALCLVNVHECDRKMNKGN